jgi:hypothetical protein
MTALWARVAPQNSLVFVEDSRGGEVPLSINNSLVSYTSTCLAIGCLCETDGETTIGIGYFENMDTGLTLEFTGFIETPSLIIAINDINRTRLLEISVKSSKTNLEVWANHDVEPDKIVVRLF